MAELNQITYNPNNWVDDSTPDIEADTLNNIEQGIAQATELLNDLVTEYKNLVSKKMIVNNFLSTNPETVLSGPMAVSYTHLWRISPGRRRWNWPFWRRGRGTV